MNKYDILSVFLNGSYFISDKNCPLSTINFKNQTILYFGRLLFVDIDKVLIFNLKFKKNDQTEQHCIFICMHCNFIKYNHV